MLIEIRESHDDDRTLTTRRNVRNLSDSRGCTAGWLRPLLDSIGHATQLIPC